MNYRLLMSLAVATALTLVGTSCNDDWGRVDPPAGNQVYPSLQKLSTVSFEDEDGAPMLPANFILQPGSQMRPEVIIDDLMGVPVLATNGGYATFANPLNDVVLQKGASVTFWVRQPMEVDGDGNPVGEQDTKGALLTIGNYPVASQPEEQASRTDLLGSTSSILSDGTVGSISISADGTLTFVNENGGSISYTDPVVTDSLYMAPNQWHFVALAVKDNGYALYVDSKLCVDKVVPEFENMNIVEFLNNATAIKLGDTETAPINVADITLYRNILTEKEAKRPNKGNIAGGGDDDSNVNKLIFGPEDNIQPWWSTWTQSVNLTGNGTIHYEFTNYTIGNNNWENWVLVLTNSGLSPNDSGYDGSQELIVLRADAWGWAALWNPDNVEHNYDWDTFTKDMNEAFVTIDITRKDDNVKMVAITKTKAGKEYNYTVNIPGVQGDLLGSFFTLENAHMEFNADETFVGETYPSGTYILGNKDFSNGFWTCWTPMVKMDAPFRNFGFEFTNHSAKGGNWQYWNFVCTNGYQSGGNDPDYYEYYYLRCDAWGWGGLYGDSEMTHGFDWDTYIEDMDGALSRIYFSFDNNTMTMVARQKRADGSEIPEYRFVTPGISLPVGLIFTCEGSWLDFAKVGYFPWANLDPQP